MTRTVCVGHVHRDALGPYQQHDHLCLAVREQGLEIEMMEWMEHVFGVNGSGRHGGGGGNPLSSLVF